MSRWLWLWKSKIDMFPIGMVFYPGKQLRLVVSSKNDLGAIMPGTQTYVPENKGKHIIYTGGEHASYLQLPVKPVPFLSESAACLKIYKNCFFYSHDNLVLCNLIVLREL